jgi:hypothetical protein
MSDKTVIEMDRSPSSILESLERQKPVALQPAVEPSQETQSLCDISLSPEELAPLPQIGDLYKAFSRIEARPLATIFFLPKGGLPDGFSYASFERVRMIEGDQPGTSPALLVRFNGSVIYEVRIEGRNLLGLCNLIGRHVIHWVREHPTGRHAGDDEADFIRRITIREIERV